MDGKAVVGTHSFYFLDVGRRSLQNIGQRTKMVQKGSGLFLAIFSGRAENKQKLEHLCISKCLNGLLLEFILKPLPVPEI